MEKVDVTEEAAAVVAGLQNQYKLEITKNSKGYNWVVGVHSNYIEQLKKDVLDLENWAKTNYS